MQALVKLYHTTTLERAVKIERDGFEDNAYEGEAPGTWWSSAPGGFVSDPAVFVAEIPGDVAAQWLDDVGTVPGQYQNFRIPAEIVNVRYPWKRLPDRDV